MQVPLRITFRHMAPSAAVETRIREHVEYLEQHFDRITACRVVIDAPPAHRNKGGPFSVHIDLSIPGHEIHVNSERDDRAAHADAYVALRDAFEAVQRQLDGHTRKQRDEVKRHAEARV